MIKRLMISIGLLILVNANQLVAQEDTETRAGKRSIYLIGNSLTWDTVPSRLDQDVQWHVDCGKSLKYIYENPQQPCVKTSTLWPTALNEKKYDVISIQPHYGTTLQEDIDTISKWIQLQPQAVIVIHSGWARSETFIDEYSKENLAETMSHQPAYFEALLKSLKKKHPETEFRQTHAMRLVIELNERILAEETPFSSITDVYRDAIHMTITSGRYLMHNAMRETIGQQRSSIGFEKVPTEVRVVLNDLLDQRNRWETANPNIISSEP